MPKVFRPIHPSWCFYAGIYGAISGIAASTFIQNAIIKSWVWLIVAALLFIIAIKKASIITLTFAFIAGLILANFRINFNFSSQEFLSKFVNETVIITGKITEDPSVDGSGTTLRLKNLTLKSPVEKPVENLEGMVYVQLPGQQKDLERSDLITVKGKLGTGFGTFVATMFRPEIISIERAEIGDIFARLKTWFADTIRTYIPSPEVDLGLGYLVGQKSGLPESLSDALRTVGMTHVIVASGAHLGILVGLAKRMFSKISRFAGLLFSLLMILGFVLIVGFTPSMTRAGLVSALSLAVGYVGRKFTPGRLLSFVAAITLLIDPTYLLNLGWQLSFASFFGLLILSPKFQRVLYGGKKPPWLASMLITSAATSLICAPILIYSFGSISLLSLVVNLIILPTLPYAMLLVFLTGATSFLPWLAHLFGRLATLLLDIHIAVVNFFSEQTMFVFELPSGDLRIFGIYLFVLAILILLQLKRLRASAKIRKLCYNESYEN